MAHAINRLATLIGSALVSATALAAPKPFDPEVAIAIANGTPVPITSDEDVVLHSISSCSPVTTPGLRVCQERPLNLPDTDSATDMIIGVN